MAVTALVLAALGSLAPGIRVVLDISELVERALPSTERNRALERDFNLGHSLLVVCTPRAPGATLEPEAIELFAAWTTREIRDNPDLIRGLSPFEIQRRRVVAGMVWTSPVVSERTPEGLTRLRETPWTGILTDTGGRDVAVGLDFSDTPGGSRFGRFDPTAIAELQRRGRVALEPLGATVHTWFTGEAAFQWYALGGVRWFQVLNVAMVAAILLVFRLLFGTWRSGALLVGVVGLAGLTVYGAMAVAGSPIDYLSTGLFLMLSVAALEDYLFLSYHQLSRGEPWGRGLRRMLVPSLLTSLTTVIGFAALTVSDLEIVRRFGMWAAFGAAVEWLVTFLVLPAFLRWTRAGPRWVDPQRAWRADLPARWAGASLPRGLAWTMLLVYPLALWAAAHLDFSDSITRLFPEGHPQREAFDYLERSRGWVGEISVVFPDASAQEPVRTTLDELRGLANVARVVDPYAIARYASGGLTAAGAFETMLAADGRARASLYLRDVSLAPLRATLDAVETACVSLGCYPAGDLVAYAEFAERVPASLLSSFAVCLLLVGGLVAGTMIATGRRRVLRVIAATFWGPALMLVVLWLFRVPVTFLTCVFASVLVGLTGDNVIQYTFAARRRGLTEGIGIRGGASIQVACVTAVACLCFLGSVFVPSRLLGLLLAIGLLASLVGDLWLLRRLVTD